MLTCVVKFKDENFGEKISNTLKYLEDLYFDVEEDEFETRFYDQIRELNPSCYDYVKNNWPFEDHHPAYLIGKMFCEPMSQTEYQFLYEGFEHGKRKMHKECLKTFFKCCGGNVKFLPQKEIDAIHRAVTDALAKQLVEGIKGKTTADDVKKVFDDFIDDCKKHS